MSDSSVVFFAYSIVVVANHMVVKNNIESMPEPSISGKRRTIVFAALALIIAAAIVRSAVTTGLDSFTYDEAYHVGAGAAYVQTGDFRMNPEQPPLTKLWTGAYVTLRGYQISEYRAFADKEDERLFVEQDAYVKNDPIRLQQDARVAMLALNGLLLLLVGVAVRRALGNIVAVAAVAFLAIDPTVAAHMPVVMTDLPVALASGAAVGFAAAGFRSWSICDLAMTAFATGLALGAKHSGIITFIAIATFGVFFALFIGRDILLKIKIKRFALAIGTMVVALVILWAMYGLRYNESPGIAEETFNRSLQEKTADIRSPLYRGALNVATTLRVFPRAYVWGMADTIRAGVEGRATQVKAFGSSYYARAPLYFFPGVVAAKLPLGLLLLSLVGFSLLLSKRLRQQDVIVPIIVFSAFTAVFLVFLMRGSSYAGVRHALPIFPLLAVLGGLAVYAASLIRSKVIHGAIGVLFILAVLSAVPRMRPWEYFNEMAGGPEGGHRYFNDEGVDLSQRAGEAASFYHSELAPNGEVPFLVYFSNSADLKARGMDWVGRDRARDADRLAGETVTGTFLIGANELGGGMWDIARPFRSAQPVKRLGNLFIYQGTFERPRGIIARSLFYRTIYGKIYTNEPDIPGAIQGIEESLALDDSCFFVSLELGNQFLKLRDREGALRAYRQSLERAPKTDTIYDLIADQVRRVETESLENVTALRNPGIE